MATTKPTATKVTVMIGRLEEEPFVLYADGLYSRDDLHIKDWFYRDDGKMQEKANSPIEYDLRVTVQLGELHYQRSATLRLPSTSRNIIEHHLEEEQSQKWDGNEYVPVTLHHRHFTYAIARQEWLERVVEAMQRVERDFCLTEAELVEAASELLKGEYEWTKLKTQVKIGERIADAILFCRKDEHDTVGEIIGIEAKADTDNYSRLYDQIDEYQNVCDKVYLVTQSKNPPPDLPSYIGVIKAGTSQSSVIRYARTIKHSMSGVSPWAGMNDHLTERSQLKERGVVRRIPFEEYFRMVERIKRKIVWNQLCIGWHSNGNQLRWDEHYQDLDDTEKACIEAFIRSQPKKRKKGAQEHLNNDMSTEEL